MKPSEAPPSLRGMAKNTTAHRCSECGWTSARWVGRLRALKHYDLELRVDGIYRLTRHPQALALCLLAVSVALVSLSRDYLFTLPLWVARWVVYTYIEERLELIPTYGDAYLRYRSTTPRILPTLRSLRAWLKKAE